MVLLLIVAGNEADNCDESETLPEASKPVNAQALMPEVLHTKVVWPPLRTRLGVAVRLLITPALTHVEPPNTWTLPLGQVQLGE